MGSRSIPGDKVKHVNSWIFLDHIWAEYRPFRIHKQLFSPNFELISHYLTMIRSWESRKHTIKIIAEMCDHA